MIHGLSQNLDNLSNDILPFIPMLNGMRSTHFNVRNKRPDKYDTFRPVRNFTEQTSAEALVTNTDVPNQGKKSQEATQPCIYYKGNHFNDSCQQYSNVSVRKKQLQKHRRYFICLKTGHVSKDCSTKFKPVIFVKWLNIIEVFVQ